SCFEIAVLEMLSELYEVSGDASVRDRLEAQIDLLVQRMINHEQGYGYIRASEDWRPQDPLRVSYGHDIKLAWLLLKGADLLGRGNDPAVVEPAVAIADGVRRDGFDQRRGGVYEEGWPGQPADDRQRVWWNQSEGMVSFFLLHQHTGDQRWRDAFERQALYALNQQVDHRCGDWYNVISARGRISFYKRQDPYHHTRACLEIIHRLKPEALADGAAQMETAHAPA
ncbi:MAG: AGE family epimerase/isomerase, partial [Phycisphaeraceae bacterium]